MLTSFAYNYNALGQRSLATLEDASTWSYAYNSKGEVTSGKQRLANGAAKEGRSYAYAYDDIGNRTTTTINGRTTTYSPNSLNQYTSRTVPNYVEVSGSADPSATVRFNGNDVLRQGSYFWRDIPVDNGASAVNLPVNISGVKLGAGANATDIVNQQTGSIFLQKTPEIFDYDLDGNQKQDGRWIYTWDGENRLIQMETLGSLPISLKQKLEFTYDWQGRRVQKKVSNWNAGTSAYVVASDTRFVWHGWNLIAEFSYATSTSTYTLIASYLWGADLSGTLEGAGGVGGLAATTTYIGATAGSYFPAYDGNGNVVAMLNSTDAGFAARYEYGPFGEPLRTSGAVAAVNPFRFSTKYQDAETSLLYYGHRYYTPSNGRWLSRDPIGDVGNSLWIQRSMELRNLISQAIREQAEISSRSPLLANMMAPSFNARRSLLEREMHLPPDQILFVEPYTAFGNNAICRIDPDGRFYWAVSGLGNIAFGFAIAKATGAPYSPGSAAIDFAVGAAGPGLISNAVKLAKLGKCIKVSAQFKGEITTSLETLKGINKWGDELFNEVVYARNLFKGQASIKTVIDQQSYELTVGISYFTLSRLGTRPIKQSIERSQVSGSLEYSTPGDGTYEMQLEGSTSGPSVPPPSSM